MFLDLQYLGSLAKGDLRIQSQFYWWCSLAFCSSFSQTVLLVGKGDGRSTEQFERASPFPEQDV